jgi:mycothiol synthase
VPTAEIEELDRLDGADLEAATALVAAAAAADGVAPLGEAALLHLRHGGPAGERILLVRAGGEPAGIAHLDPDPDGGATGELAVHPAHRGRGLGRALTERALARPDGGVRLWAHGDLPAARALAASLGLVRVREVLQLRRPLTGALPDPDLPPGVRVRAFRPGLDDAAWLRLNARAFADHPEQGRWTERDLAERLAEDWFDPAGFLLAEDTGGTEDTENTGGALDAEAGGTLVAAHWTKVHATERLGEVYVVAVDPDRAGHGLGTAITLAGLRRLQAAGLPEAMLYTEAGNAPALAVYRRLGFTRHRSDVVFQHPQTSPSGETMA